VRVTLISLCAVRIIWAALAAVLSREIHDRPRKFAQLRVILCIHRSVGDFEQRGQQTVVALRQRARELLEHTHNLVVEISSAKKRQALNEVLVGLAVSVIRVTIAGMQLQGKAAALHFFELYTLKLCFQPNVRNERQGTEFRHIDRDELFHIQMRLSASGRQWSWWVIPQSEFAIDSGKLVKICSSISRIARVRCV